eukprot:6249658-Prymnesium_polylepis.3
MQEVTMSSTPAMAEGITTDQSVSPSTIVIACTSSLKGGASNSLCVADAVHATARSADLDAFEGCGELEGSVSCGGGTEGGVATVEVMQSLTVIVIVVVTGSPSAL